MKTFLTPLLYIAFGFGLASIAFYVYSLNQEPTTQVVNEFRKIKNKKGTTDIDVTSEVSPPDEEKKRKIFNKNKNR